MEFPKKKDLQNLEILTTEHHRINAKLSWNLNFAEFTEIDERNKTEVAEYSNFLPIFMTDFSEFC